jgi:hypothetical protein
MCWGREGSSLGGSDDAAAHDSVELKLNEVVDRDELNVLCNSHVVSELPEKEKEEKKNALSVSLAYASKKLSSLTARPFPS